MIAEKNTRQKLLNLPFFLLTQWTKSKRLPLAVRIQKITRDYCSNPIVNQLKKLTFCKKKKKKRKTTRKSHDIKSGLIFHDTKSWLYLTTRELTTQRNQSKLKNIVMSFFHLLQSRGKRWKAPLAVVKSDQLNLQQASGGSTCRLEL